MTNTVTIPLREPATEISREEILKQVAHLSGSLQKPRIPPDGSRLEFEIEAAGRHSPKVVNRNFKNILPDRASQRHLGAR